ncbi:hypothetical protein ARMSODRAFT_981288 [Armillaria solidipes]|uniref:Uncharacterized protein n=1 Tax=Armillaria solidipes TaxID=1076256 RepID=A0A2H3BF83_9AGAR|nr:hypothetical protein ARMSODRAFT_981288 [Armillaria solidipes]
MVDMLDLSCYKAPPERMQIIGTLLCDLLTPQLNSLWRDRLSALPHALGNVRFFRFTHHSTQHQIEECIAQGKGMQPFLVQSNIPSWELKKRVIPLNLDLPDEKCHATSANVRRRLKDQRVNAHSNRGWYPRQTKKQSQRKHYAGNMGIQIRSQDDSKMSVTCSFGPDVWPYLGDPASSSRVGVVPPGGRKDPHFTPVLCFDGIFVDMVASRARTLKKVEVRASIPSDNWSPVQVSVFEGLLQDGMDISLKGLGPWDFSL